MALGQFHSCYFFGGRQHISNIPSLPPCPTVLKYCSESRKSKTANSIIFPSAAVGMQATRRDTRGEDLRASHGPWQLHMWYLSGRGRKWKRQRVSLCCLEHGLARVPIIPQLWPIQINAQTPLGIQLWGQWAQIHSAGQLATAYFPGWVSPPISKLQAISCPCMLVTIKLVPAPVKDNRWTEQYFAPTISNSLCSHCSRGSLQPSWSLEIIWRSFLGLPQQPS